MLKKFTDSFKGLRAANITLYGLAKSVRKGTAKRGRIYFRVRAKRGRIYFRIFRLGGMVEAIPAVSGFPVPSTIAADVSSHLEIP
ncbi:hypothetical protein D3C71_1067440 [compost metagenome]|jgi:hypothetical protein